jgi:hypothetical protein
MKPKQRIKIVAVNLILFAVLFLLVQANKTYIRPNVSPDSTINWISGWLPNFLSGLLITLMFVNATLQAKPKRSELIMACAAIGISLILAIEEFTGMWGASTQYDLGDIIGGIVGSGLAWGFYKLIKN